MFTLMSMVKVKSDMEAEVNTNINGENCRWLKTKHVRVRTDKGHIFNRFV